MCVCVCAHTAFDSQATSGHEIHKSFPGWKLVWPSVCKLSLLLSHMHIIWLLARCIFRWAKSLLFDCCIFSPQQVGLWTLIKDFKHGCHSYCERAGLHPLLTHLPNTVGVWIISANMDFGLFALLKCCRTQLCLTFVYISLYLVHNLVNNCLYSP